MWHFRNDEETFSTDKFRPNSSFNLRNKDTIIETHLSCSEEKLQDIEVPSKRHNNLIEEERDALDNLGDGFTILTEDADKDSVVVVWDREDYLKETYKQLPYEVHEEVLNNPSVLVNTIIKALEKICQPKFAGFYLLTKIHKR